MVRYNNRRSLPLGDAVLIFAMFIWLTVAVGPWWLGAGLFVMACILNWLHQRVAP